MSASPSIQRSLSALPVNSSIGLIESRQPTTVHAAHFDDKGYVEDRIGGEDESSNPAPSQTECLRGWIVLLGCVMIAITNMGLGMAQGTLQSYYARGPYRSTPESVISLVGGLLAFLCTMGAQFGGRAADSFGYRPTLLFGSVIAALAIVLDALSTKMWQVFLTQGVMYGFGQAFSVPLILALPSQWFSKHRGLATGLVGGSAGLGGGITSLILRSLISHFGSTREALAILAGMWIVVWAVAWCLIKENRPTPDLSPLWHRGGGEKPKFKIARRPGLGDLMHDGVFWSLMLCIFLSCFGYLTPFAYLTTYTEDVVIPGMAVESVSTLTATWPLFACNLGMFLGRTVVGVLADKIGAVQMLVMALEVAGVLQIAAWHYATSFGGVMAFAVTYGLLGGSALSLLSIVIAQIWGVRENHVTAVGFLMFATAPGSLGGPALAGAMLNSLDQNWLAFQSISGALQIAGGLVGLFTWWKGVGWRWGNVSRLRGT